jgi:hypothetical protein
VKTGWLCAVKKSQILISGNHWMVNKPTCRDKSRKNELLN